MSSRRDFVKMGCIACMGLTGISTLLEACSAPLQVVKFGNLAEPMLLTVSATKFTEQTKMLVLRAEHLDNDILLVKNKDRYNALLMLCTHEGFPLTPTDSKIFCNAHGSQFDMEGNVLKEPALKPLVKYKTLVINNNINIYLNQKI